MMITCPLCHCLWYGEDNLSPDTVITCSCGNGLTIPTPTGSPLADRIDRLIAEARVTAEIWVEYNDAR